MAKHWKWGFVILAAVWAALFGNMLGYAWNVTHREEPIPEVPMEQIQNTNISEVAQETMDRFWTVAVFGVDSREGKLGKGTRSGYGDGIKYQSGDRRNPNGVGLPGHLRKD